MVGGPGMSVILTSESGGVEGESCVDCDFGEGVRLTTVDEGNERFRGRKVGARTLPAPATAITQLIND